MRKSITFGQFYGIPLQVHINWFLIAALVTWSLAVGYFPQEHPGWDLSAYWIVGIATSILFFGSVLFHELGHARIALREGVPVNSITLFIFGGIAHIAHEPETAGSEFRIVIAGPLSSFSLAVVFQFLGRALTSSSELSSAALYLSQINLLLAVFNLLPGFPLDGGRILRSIFWKWNKDFIQATLWAARAGLGIAMLFVLFGIVLMLSGNFFNGLWVAFIGWYLSTASWTSYRQTIAEQAEGDRGLEPGRQSPAGAIQAWTLRERPASTQSLKTSPLEVPVGVLSTALPILGPSKPPCKPSNASMLQRTNGEVISNDPQD
jgi:Zn-dependent protease